MSHWMRRTLVGVTAAATAATLAACTGSSTQKATIGAVVVSVPQGWKVVDDRPQGWAWAAQDVPKEGASTQQLAIDGRLAGVTTPELGLGLLTSGAQIGGFPAFTQIGPVTKVSVSGAKSAQLLRFRYRIDRGAIYHGAWLVACRADRDGFGALQLASVKEIDDEQARSLARSVSLTEPPTDDSPVQARAS